MHYSIKVGLWIRFKLLIFFFDQYNFTGDRHTRDIVKAVNNVSIRLAQYALEKTNNHPSTLHTLHILVFINLFYNFRQI